MSDQKSQAQQEQQPQKIQTQFANVQARPVTSPPPVSNALKPNKTVKVPQYYQCLAGDATPIEEVIHAVNPKKASE
jgi:hypothetical protein